MLLGVVHGANQLTKKINSLWRRLRYGHDYTPSTIMLHPLVQILAQHIKEKINYDFQAHTKSGGPLSLHFP